MSNKKTREIQLPMKFNPALDKYEPELPLRKGKNKIKFHWILYLIILIAILCFGFSIIISLINYK